MIYLYGWLAISLIIFFYFFIKDCWYITRYGYRHSENIDFFFALLGPISLTVGFLGWSMEICNRYKLINYQKTNQVYKDVIRFVGKIIFRKAHKESMIKEIIE